MLRNLDKPQLGYLLLFLVLSSCASAFLWAHAGKEAREQGVSFRIIAPESTVCSGSSSLKLEVELRNDSNHAVRLQPHGIDGIHFRTSRPPSEGSFGNVYAVLDKNLDPFPHENPTSAIVLQPGGSYTTSLNLSLADDFFSTEGFYKLSVHYDGVLHPTIDARGVEPELFRGQLNSNWLIFQIEKCETTMEPSH